MKSFFSLSAFCFFVLIASGQGSATNISTPDPLKKILIAEAACGKCQFHLKDNGCNLAVRINGKSYFVDGADIDAFGDAHSKEGFCNAISKAEVQGEIVKNRFKATYFKVIKQPVNNLP